METKSFFIIPLLLLLAICAHAQSDPNDYRNLAAMHIWTQNCEKAQKCYNVYKDLVGKPLEKMDVLIACECRNEKSNLYTISYDVAVLLSTLESSNITDKDLILRVVGFYTNPDEKLYQLRRLANVYPSIYEALAKGMGGDAWYDAIIVQKKI